MEATAFADAAIYRAGPKAGHAQGCTTSRGHEGKAAGKRVVKGPTAERTARRTRTRAFRSPGRQHATPEDSPHMSSSARTTAARYVKGKQVGRGLRADVRYCTQNVNEHATPTRHGKPQTANQAVQRLLPSARRQPSNPCDPPDGERARRRRRPGGKPLVRSGRNERSPR